MPERRSLLCVVSQTLFALASALWLGGLVSLFVSVQTLFSHDRDLALVAAPVLFDVFDLYQRGLAVAGIVAVVGVLLTRPNRSAVAGSILLALNVVPAAVVAFYVMPKMSGLLASNAGSSPDFKWLHGLSMMLYCGETLLLLGTVLLLPWSFRGRRADVAQRGFDAEVAR